MSAVKEIIDNQLPFNESQLGLYEGWRKSRLSDLRQLCDILIENNQNIDSAFLAKIEDLRSIQQNIDITKEKVSLLKVVGNSI